MEARMQALPPLIPREVLFGNPVRTSPKISPDGRYLAYLAPDDRNVLQVWLRAVGQQDDRVLTADKKRGIRTFFWPYDGEQLIYLQDRDGDEEWHFYATHLRTGQVRDLTPFEGIQARPVAQEPGRPHELLVALNLEDRRKHDVYRVDLRNGAVERDTENPGTVDGWWADAALQVRATRLATPDGGYDLRVREAGEPWRTARHWGPEEDANVVGFSADGKTLYLSASHDASTTRLLALDLTTGTERVLAEDPENDLAGTFIHPVTKAVQAVSYLKERLEWQALDPGIAADLDALARARRGDLHLVSRDLEDRRWVVSYTTDDGPASYYLYDRGTRETEFLFSDRPELEGLSLAPMRPISYRSRDGLTIHGYLTLPVGVPARELPTVLLVHGGPWGRDTWGFDSGAQWLANRGYAVLQVNFRGSWGYGKRFLHAGDREWAGRMHDDLIDGVEWIVGQGIADRKKVAIMGGSYGGYATLVGLTFTPEVFVAGVDIVGPSNLITLMRTIPPYWTPGKAMFAYRIGDVETEEEFLKSRSPVFFADRIRVPLLIGQGANDPRVKQAESEQIVAAMRRANLPVEYVVYTDEGHGFARPENRLHFNARAEEFLARHLGGRFEPVGEMSGHSAVDG
jgi:dipeptidyl aminopeptidase/acylaminoacyl peptidase